MRIMATLWLVLSGFLWASEFEQALKDGKIMLDLNLRMEHVDQEFAEKDALATTLRTRLGYQTGVYRGFSLLIDFENITALDDNAYNDTINGEFQRPVVVDPEGSELNRAQLTYSSGVHELILGRRRLIHDNARFIGNVGWRQNEQTFDGLFYKHKFNAKSSLEVSYVDNVNRIFGEYHPSDTAADLRQNSWLVRYHIADLPVGNLSVFAHLLDFKDAPSTAHRNIGFRLNGAWKITDDVSMVHDLSYAQQDDYRDGADTIDADYTHISWGPKWGDFTLTANYERLSGDGDYAFVTPLATLHAFNGWADIFLGTPRFGLQDLYLKAVYTWNKWRFLGIYHQFESDVQNIDYGDEINFQVTRQWNRIRTGLKFADYTRDDLGQDTTKAWIWAGYKL